MGNSILKRYLITCGAALVIMAGVVALEAGSSEISGDILHMASDACFVSGMLLLIAAAFMFVANGGGFHPFGYLRKRIQYTVTGNREHLMSYTDYVLSRKQKGKMNLSHLFITGGILVGVSLILALV